MPFLALWPGHVAAGSRTDQTVCHTDLLRTAADLLGAALPETAAEDSVSFLPALLGRATAPPRDATVHHSIDGSFAIRQGPWKLAFCPGSGGWSAPNDQAAFKQGLPRVQLYNLAKDPGETNNLQTVHPEKVASLTKLMKKYVTDGRSTPGEAQPNDVAVKIAKSSATLEKEKE